MLYVKLLWKILISKNIVKVFNLRKKIPPLGVFSENQNFRKISQTNSLSWNPLFVKFYVCSLNMHLYSKA